jgi:hypothetical protein
MFGIEVLFGILLLGLLKDAIIITIFSIIAVIYDVYVWFRRKIKAATHRQASHPSPLAW